MPISSYTDLSGHGLVGTVLPLLRWRTPGPTDAMPGLTFTGLVSPAGALARNTTVAALPIDGTPFTVEFWLRQENGSSTFMAPVGWGTQNYSHDIIADFQDLVTTSRYLEIYGNVFNFLAPDGVLPHDGTWHHVVIATDGATEASFYVNAVLVGTGSHALVTEDSWIANTVAVGSGPFGWDEELIGQLVAVAIYDHELPLCRVQAHYAASGRRNLSRDLAAELAADPLYARVYPLSAHITPAGARSAVHVPWAFVRGTYAQPQHQPRTLATPEGASPLRAIAVGDTTAADAILAPDEQNVAYWVDWTNTLPQGITIASASVQILMRPGVSTAWSAATDVTLTFLSSVLLDNPQTRVVLADGTQTLDQQYRVRILATFSNSPATILEAFFDLTCAES